MAMFQDHGPDITGVYRLLEEHGEEGIRGPSSWERSPPAGPAKRRYALTSGGRACLTRWITTLRTYRDAVSQHLLDTASSSGAAKPRHGGNRRASTPEG